MVAAIAKRRFIIFLFVFAAIPTVRFSRKITYQQKHSARIQTKHTAILTQFSRKHVRLKLKLA